MLLSELFAAGILITEIPLNSPEPMKSIRRAVKLFGDRMLVGAGTVTHVAEVEQVRDPGARLVVSPHADADIVHETKRLNLISISGIGTATEGFAMVRAGADALNSVSGGCVWHAHADAIASGSAQGNPSVTGWRRGCGDHPRVARRGSGRLRSGIGFV